MFKVLIDAFRSDGSIIINKKLIQKVGLEEAVIYRTIKNKTGGHITMVKILALDGSSTKTGYSIFENGKLIKSGVIDISKKDKSSIKRCRYLFKEIISITVANDIQVIVYEEQLRFAIAGAFALISSAYVTATIELVSELRGIECISIPIKTWKSISGINTKGRVNQKKQAKELVKEYYDVKTNSDDEADSILIGYAYIKNINSSI